MSDLRVTNLKGRTPGSSPTLPDGVVVTGVATATNVSASSSITAASFHGDGSQLEGIDATALKDSNSTVRVQATTTGAVVTGILTATSFSGIDESSLSDSDGTTRVQATTSGAVITGVLTATTFSGNFSGDGSALTFAPKIIAYDPAALSIGSSISSNITFTFDQTIEFAGTGTIEVRETSNSGTIATSFAISGGVAPSGLSISGSQLIINPTDPLNLDTVHYVVLPSAGIANTLGSYYAGSSDYNFKTEAQSFSATGGDTVFTLEDSNSPTGYYKYHIFTSPGNLVAANPSVNAVNFSSMLVAGGGSGGFAGAGGAGGGGGAGGVVKHTGPTLNFPAGTWAVTLGNGGPSTNSVSNSGENSTLVIAGVTSITAYGGGKGGVTGEPGGSGGGSTSSGAGNQRPGGTGISGQGNPGGTAPSPNTTIANVSGNIGGGGGGSASAGGNASYSGSNPYTAVTGSGGNASPNPEFTSTILAPRVSQIPAPSWAAIGSAGQYGGGGAGGMFSPPQPTIMSSGSTSAGGGQGGVSSSGTSAQAFTGSGGGGSGSSTGGGGAGGNGGSGVFMVRYASPN